MFGTMRIPLDHETRRLKKRLFEKTKLTEKMTNPNAMGRKWLKNQKLNYEGLVLRTK